MTQPESTPPAAKMCPACGIRKSGPYPNDWCRHCYDISRNDTTKLPADLAKLVADAQKTGNWKTLADSLAPVVESIARGLVKATAAQTSLLKHIMDRAYGKVSKSQEDKAGPVGVILLPTLGEGQQTHLCAQCVEAHKTHNNA